MHDRLNIWTGLLTVLLVVLFVPVMLAVWPYGPLARIAVMLTLLAVYAAALGIGSVALMASESRRNTQIGRIQQQKRAAYQARIMESANTLYLHD